MVRWPVVTMRDEFGYESTAEACPFCGAVPYEPCEDMRGGGGGQMGGSSGTGGSSWAMPRRRHIKRIHPERRPSFLAQPTPDNASHRQE